METQELTIIDRVKDVINKSGVAFEIDITELFSLAERGKAIKDVNDPNFAIVKKEMQQKRKYVTEYFKDARSEFNRMRDGIIEVQNLVLAEFTPEEDRLIALDKAEKERVLKEERLAGLPAKRERVDAIGFEFTDEEILALTDADFEIEFITRMQAKVQADQLAYDAKLAEERAAFEAEKAELARKQAEADAIEAARKEERERAEKALQLAKETAEREEKERKERIEREEKERKERIEREAKEKADAEIEARRIAMEEENKRQANEKFQAFLTKNKFSNETDIIKQGADGKFRLYRLVATYE